MAEGTSTYDGLAVPLSGESEIVATTVGKDIITLTGASGHTGDFIVCQTSAGVENFVVTVDGVVTSQAQQQLNLTATTQSYGMDVVVSSTGALAALGTAETAVNGVRVSPSSKAIMNAAYAYAGGDTASVNTAITMLACFGANSLPSYFLAVPTTTTDAIYKGAHAGDHGFLDASLLINTFTCDHPFVGLKCLSGSNTLYLLGVQATGIT